MKNILSFVFIFMCFQTMLLSYYASFDHNLVLDSMDKGPNSQMTDEEVLDYFQIYFIKENFLNPAFSKRHKFFGDDENEDANEFTVTSDFEQDYSMDLMLKEVAKIMAEKNIFHLKEYLKREYRLDVNERSR